jgi:hypothetical protein
VVSVIVHNFFRVLLMAQKRSLQGKISQRQREQDYAAIKVQRKAAWQYIRETEFRDALPAYFIIGLDFLQVAPFLAL